MRSNAKVMIYTGNLIHPECMGKYLFLDIFRTRNTPALVAIYPIILSGILLNLFWPN